MQDKTVRIGEFDVKVRDKPRSREEHEAAEKRARKRGEKFVLAPEDANRNRKRYTITLSAQAHAIARKIGKQAGGRTNVSGGIERALMHWFDCPRTDRRRRK
jgi:hypothetical protein